MPSRVPPSDDQLHDVEVLIRAHHPLLFVESIEEDRVHTLLAYLSDRIGIPLFTWNPNSGLSRLGPGGGRTAHTESPELCLAFIEQANLEAIFHLRGMTKNLDDPAMMARLKEIYRRYFKHRGTVVITGSDIDLPAELDPLFTHVELAPPTPDAYHQFVATVLRDISKRQKVQVELSQEEINQLLHALRGLTFFEVQKIITQAVVEDGRLDSRDLDRVFQAKRRIVERSGVLEYFPHEHDMKDIAGLTNLKAWLEKRQNTFADPERARAFGLDPPKGLLLIGAPGCGKSLCAKAVAAQWKLPLIRLDPSKVYQKFFGESEKNLNRAIRTAETLAPVVLWIDEIEKALGPGDQDGGTSQRVFGTFLTWMQEKKENVFVIATANDISKLPPELLRKGRFDEIFFVDLPGEETRRRIFEVHLRRRDRDPQVFDVDRLAAAAVGFSGAEIEQAIVSALYTAFSHQGTLDTPGILTEIDNTRPLYHTMAEKIDALRAWARDRAVAAE